MSSNPQENSIPEQRKWAREAAPEAGVSLLAEFADPGISGGKGADRRPQLQAMLDYCERQFMAGVPVGAVLVWDMDRLSRQDSLDSAALLAGLRQAGVSRFLTATEGWLDTDDATQRVMHLIKQDFGRAEFRSKLAQNILRGMKDKAETGAWLGGVAPTGYRLVDGFLEPDPVTGPVITGMFRLYAAGTHSIRRLCVWLVTQGVKAPRSADGLWYPAVVRHMLTNPAYLGHSVWNARHTGTCARITGGKVKGDDSARSREQQRRRRGMKHAPETANASADVMVRQNAHPALIDPATFAAVASRLASNRKQTGPLGADGPYFLSGLCRCGACGARMHGEYHAGGKAQRLRYYACSTARLKGSCWAGKRVAQEFLLDEVVADIKERFADEAALARVREEVAKLAAEGDEDLQAEHARLKTRRDQLEADVARGNANLLLLPADRIAGAVAMLRQWEAEQQEITARLDRMTVALDSRQRLAREADDGIAQLQQLGRVIREAPPEMARAALTQVVQGVTVHFERKPGGKTNRDMEVTSIEVAYTDWVLSLFSTGDRR
jgi:site-specific DNA recombinase